MRRIIHIDMDCFFAAVEQKINSSLQGKPIAVGGAPGKRGVIATASYEARAYGVRSAMSSSVAVRLCPDLILVRGHYERYKIESQAIREIFHEYTDKVQPLSLDEAYLDVSDYVLQHKTTATKLAAEIRQRIFEKTGLTASAGIAPNKLLAKIASDIKKPNGQYTVTPDKISEFVSDLPVNKIWGVGKVTASKMGKMGITTCGELQKYTQAELFHYFGKFGRELFYFCRGQDEREVHNDGERKSLSVEHTFNEDIPTIEGVKQRLDEVYSEFEQRIQKYDLESYKTIFIKMKYTDFKQSTMERPFEELDKQQFFELVEKLWHKRAAPIRLLGVGIKFKTSEQSKEQLSFLSN